MIDIIKLFLHSFWSVLGQMAPYLIFGYLIAGVLSVFVTTQTVQRHLGGSKFASTLKAALFGMPLPLCSCSVIPVTASLRKSGAGRGAIASFLISTPTTGVDSILAAWALMGPVFAVYRAIMSVILGVVTGSLVNLFGDDDGAQEVVAAEHNHDQSGDSCSCESEVKQGSMIARALKYGFITIPRDLGKALFVGIIVASIISALIDANYIDQFLGNGIGTMLIMLIVGIPLYVCATASIPLALGFMALGASPGAAFVFLIAGPATNAATITVLWKMIGKKSTIIMLTCMFFGALLGGLLLDSTWKYFGFMQVTGQMESISHEANWFYSISAIALIIIQLWSIYGKRLSVAIAGGSHSKVEDSCCHSEKAVPDSSSCCSSDHTEVVTSSCCSSNESQEKSSCCSESANSSEGSCCCSDKDDSNDGDFCSCSK